MNYEVVELEEKIVAGISARTVSYTHLNRRADFYPADNLDRSNRAGKHHSSIW